MATRIRPASLIPGVAVLPTFAAASVAGLYLAGWPAGTSGGVKLLLGIGLGLVGWVAVSLLACGRMIDVESASPQTYEDLCTRVMSLRVRVAPAPLPWRPGAMVAHAEANELLQRLAHDLRLDPRPDEYGPPDRRTLKWLLGIGYVNLWTRMHRIEEALLEVEPKEQVLPAARKYRAVLRTMPLAEAEALGAELDAYLTPTGRTPLVAVDGPDARALIRESSSTIHKEKDAAWTGLVNQRNRLFATMVLTSFGAFALLTIAVVREAPVEAVAAAAVFSLVGAGVGLFRELYAASQRRGGVGFDYGLGYVRLLTVPVLSAIAAIGGVAVTKLGSNTSMPLEQVYSLEDYSFGLVVAAIFGLTPSMLLQRLDERADEYRQQLRPRAPAGQPEAPSARAAAAKG